MTPYAKGYQTGWIAYLEEYRAPEKSLRILKIQAEALAEHASQGLLPKDDYWMGYHHGRNAAQACVELYLRTNSPPSNSADTSATNA
jgi:hypothetical protein